MKNSYKLSRINETIKSSLAQVIVEFDKGELITVLKVDTNPDLSFSKVFITSLSHPEKCVKRLNQNAGDIWAKVASMIRIRRLPRFHFTFDKNINVISELDI